MLEATEIINLLVSIFLFIYMPLLLKKLEISISRYWTLCISFLIISNIFSVLDTFGFEKILSLLAHSFFMVACLFFLLAISSKTQVT